MQSLVRSEPQRQARTFLCAATVGIALSAGGWCGALDSGSKIVEAGDLDGDGHLTGRDLELAVERCRPGCVLRVGAGVYEDVALQLTSELSSGIVIEGDGIGTTVLRASVPVESPVLWIRGRVPNVILRGFTIDGRSREQPDAARVDRSFGVWVSNPARENSPDGMIDGIEVMNLLKGGVIIRDGRQWTVRNSKIHDIGCHTEIPCPKLQRVANGGDVRGRKAIGYGINIIESTAPGALVENNEVWNVTKIGIQAYTLPDSPEILANFTFRNNTVRKALGSGIVVFNSRNGRVEENNVKESGGQGIHGNMGAGIACAEGSSNLVVRNNQVADNDGPGLRLLCQGDDVEVVGNRVAGNCRKQLGNFGDIQVVGSPQGSRGLRLEENETISRKDGCFASLFIGRWDDVTVTGGDHRGGRYAGVFLTDVRNVVMRKSTVIGSQGAGVVLRDGACGVDIDSSVKILEHVGPRIVGVAKPCPEGPRIPSPRMLPER